MQSCVTNSRNLLNLGVWITIQIPKKHEPSDARSVGIPRFTHLKMPLGPSVQSVVA